MSQRIEGYDLARAFAVFGMVVVNFKIVMGADAAGPHPLLTAAGLLEGRAAATFVVLAGVGLSLTARRALAERDPGALSSVRIRLLKRAFLLFVIGLLYTPLWPADILHFYGLYIAIGALMLAASNRSLWLAAASLTGLFAALILVLDYEKGWDWATLHYSGLWTPGGMIRHLFFNGFHPVIPWAAFLLVGMAIGRLDLSHPATRRRVLFAGLGVAGAAETVSQLTIRQLSQGATSEERELVGALFGTAPMPPMPFYLLAGAGVACAVIAACVALSERFPGSPLLAPLVATGQLALTLYVAHVIVGMGTLEAVARLEGQSVPFTMASAAVFCLAATVFAYAWRRRFRRGPLEAILRRATR